MRRYRFARASLAVSVFILCSFKEARIVRLFVRQSISYAREIVVCPLLFRIEELNGKLIVESGLCLLKGNPMLFVFAAALAESHANLIIHTVYLRNSACQRCGLTTLYVSSVAGPTS
jgi:hypothetical protein